MNKTVNINLGGMFFHIDEDAFQKLTRYFDAIKRSLSNSNGQDEIIRDIEMRIGELISERHTSDKQVINLKELDEIIAIMGQPEDYRIDEEPTTAGATSDFSSPRRNKKLYRDTEKGMIGGVATGLGHYFGIDSVWLKIIFLLFVFFGFGTGVVAYIVLWIVTPAAVTTSEKLEMTGEPVNISNIERKVREEFANMSDRFKNSDFSASGTYVRTGADRVAANVGNAFLTVLKVFAKILGVFLVVFSAGMLIAMFVGMFTVGSTTFMDVPALRYINAENYTDQPLWLLSLLALGAFGIPLFGLFILGLKLLITNMRSIGNIAKYTLMALWILSVAALIALGIKQATEVAFDGKVTSKQQLSLQPTDTLNIKFRYNEKYANDVEDYEEFLFLQGEDGKEIIYSSQVELYIMKTDEKRAFIQIEKVAEGKSLHEAKGRAEKIQYGYSLEGNELILDNYLLTNIENKYRDQTVKVLLYLPEGTLLKPDTTVEQHDYSDNEFFNLHFSGNYTYRVGTDKVLCLDCPAEENEFGDVVYGDPADSTATTVKINENGIQIKHGRDEEVTISKGLKFDENGTVTKPE